MKRFARALKTLLEIDTGKRWMLAQLFASSGLSKIATLLPPIATAGIVGVVTENNFDGVWYYVVLYVVFYVLYSVTLRWNMWAYTQLSNYYCLDVQRRAIDHVAESETMPNELSRGKIVGTCGEDIRYVVDAADMMAEVATNAVKLVIIVMIFLFYSVWVAMLALAVDLLYLKLMDDNSRKISRHYEGNRKYEDKMVDVLNQILMNVRQVKTLNLMPHLNEVSLDKSRKRWKEHYQLRRGGMSDRKTTLPWVLWLGKIVLYVFLAWMVVRGKMNLEELVLLVSYFELMQTCTDTMLENMLNLDMYSVRLMRVKNILDYHGQKEFDFGEIENDYINGMVEFKNVNYKVGGQQVLDDVSLKFYPNEVTAIVGHSGSGKTSVLNVLYRLVRVNSGSVMIDGESIYNYSKNVYFTNVSGVYQHPFVFEMSIRDNLALVEPNHRKQIAACKRVGIHQAIMKLPRGYNTVISEEEELLSEGEKRLLAIARAVLTKAEILLFDEVTGDIEPELAKKIGEVLEDLKIDHTVVIVTHNPLVMGVADRVVVMDGGKVKAKGMEKEVEEKSKLYRELKSVVVGSRTL